MPGLGLPGAPGSTDDAGLGDDYLRALRARLELVLSPSDKGTIGSRPVSTAQTPGVFARHYFATDATHPEGGVLYFDSGTAWVQSTGLTRLYRPDAAGIALAAGNGTNVNYGALAFAGAAGTAAGDPTLFRSAPNVLKTLASLEVGGAVKVGGALDHDGSTFGLCGVPPTAPQGWGTLVFTNSRDFNANIVTTPQLGNVVGTLIGDLQAKGILGGSA